MRHLHLTALKTTATVLTAGLLLAGCGGDDTSDPKAAGQEIAGGSTLGQTWPLTGLDVEGDSSSAQTHPVMVAKIDNTESSAPQVGLGSADLVVEELVEGGSTRLAAFFYSDIPDQVGPIRSMRASDIGIVSPVDASVVTSGAAPVTIKRITGAGIKFYGEGSPGMSRATDRTAPYNLMNDMSKLVDTLPDSEERRPDDYLQWGKASDLPKGKKATTLAANFGNHTTNWAFQGGEYVNQNSYAADGDQFTPDTVLVLRVPVGDAGYTDPAGNPVPETKLDGKGQALLFHDGEVVKGAWEKSGLDAPLELSAGKNELTVPAGNTWIELVPAANGNVTWK
ncbi:DUF3048 domain-containing protein [Nocardioides sp. GXQ0305]|uniref:DUF3048 domain-containing protein n=1 Tax=Nocardioides sp. GXQ0305 TaxID=3423912 RepID=UPI003D7EF366